MIHAQDACATICASESRCIAFRCPGDKEVSWLGGYVGIARTASSAENTDYHPVNVISIYLENYYEIMPGSEFLVGNVWYVVTGSLPTECLTLVTGQRGSLDHCESVIATLWHLEIEPGCNGPLKPRALARDVKILPWHLESVAATENGSRQWIDAYRIFMDDDTASLIDESSYFEVGNIKYKVIRVTGIGRPGRLPFAICEVNPWETS